MRRSKWKGLLGEMYKYKYYSTTDYSKLSKETKERHFKFYKDKYDIELEFDQCSFRPAMKATAKILINCVWGKHAESVDHPQSIVLTGSDFDRCNEFYHKIDRTQFKFESNRDKVRPNLHKGYAPCAVFVPMYGQMQ